MPPPTSHHDANNGVSARQELLVATERLPKPDRAAFTRIAPPPDSELEGYRIAEDPKLRGRILSSGLGELVQRSGPGNWSKTSAPAYIVRVYPNFDAPTASLRPRATRTRGSEERALSIGSTLVSELRAKWEQYYLETRPKRQLEHERRADSADPTLIAERAQELIKEAQRSGQRLTTRDAVLQATDEVTSDFETVLRRRFGDAIVDIFGVPAP